MRVFISILFSLTLVVGTAQAQTSTGSVPVAAIRTGWMNDLFAVDTGGTYLNPANCQVTDGYYASGANPGYKTYYAVALLAFAIGKNVTVILSNSECTELRPRIIGITNAK